MEMIIESKYLTICLFALRMGNSGDNWKIAYGVVYPAVEKMSAPIVSGSKVVGTCEFGKLSMRKIVLSGERDDVLSIFEDLSNGVSLKTSFLKHGVDISNIDFDIKYSQTHINEEWGLESMGKSEKVYTKKVTMLEPLELVEKDGVIARDAETAIRLIENYLNEQTGINFDENIDHIGNLEVIIYPEVDEFGKPLVWMIWDKDAPWGISLLVNKKVLEHSDEIIVNVKSIENNRIINDIIDKVIVKEISDIKREYLLKLCPDRINVKIWRQRGNETIVLMDKYSCILKNINLSIGLQQPTIKVNTNWLEDIKKNISTRYIHDVDKAKTIDRVSKQHVVIGNKVQKRHKRKIQTKENDEFFPKGWDPLEQEHGMLSFLEWFKLKAKGANSIFLQDPYFEDVAMFFLASAEIDSNYMVLTQTNLKTNVDSTNAFMLNHNSERRNKITDTIKSYPLLFETMKLEIKDVPATHNVLHDRYLVFSYGYRVEAYTLSNSLQGATKKHPLLVTQIGDNALNKLSEYIKALVNREDIETIYNYNDKGLRNIESELADVADVGFGEWLYAQKDVMLRGKVSHVLHDIRSWRTYDRLSTFGCFLANLTDKEAYQIMDYIVDEMRCDSYWILTLKDFILKGHYSTFPIGYIGSSHKSFRYLDITSLLGMSFINIVDSSNLCWLDNIFCEGYTFGVYGQYYAARLLLRLSIEEYVNILKLLKPTLLGIKSDKTITPCYKVTSMMMHVLIESDYFTNSNEVEMALIGDVDEVFRGIGCLICLSKWTKDELKYEDFLHLIKNDELIKCCHVALEVGKHTDKRDVFYNKLKDVFVEKADTNYFTNVFLKEILGERGTVEDKVQYIEKIVLPLMNVGFLNRLCISNELIKKIHVDCIVGRKYIKDSLLAEFLYAMDGDLQLLLKIAQTEVCDFKLRLKTLVIKDNVSVFEESQKCMRIQRLLKCLIEKYADRVTNVVEDIKNFYSDLNVLLHEYGIDMDCCN